MNQRISSLFVLIMLASVMVFGQTAFADKDGIANEGYDVVAYFTQHDAVKGSATFTAEHNDLTYYFSSEEHKTAFVQNPDKYLPAYGGYCAFAMAMQGKSVPVDPETFKLRDGKLYLFYNGPYQGSNFNTIIPWNENEQELVAKADANWGGE